MSGHRFSAAFGQRNYTPNFGMFFGTPLLLLLNMRGPETCSYEFITSHGLQRHVLQLVV